MGERNRAIKRKRDGERRGETGREVSWSLGEEGLLLQMEQLGLLENQRGQKDTLLPLYNQTPPPASGDGHQPLLHLEPGPHQAHCGLVPEAWTRLLQQLHSFHRQICIIQDN